MKKALSLTAVIFAFGSSLAFAEEPEIVGGISDGTTKSEPAPLPLVPEFREISQLTFQANGRRVLLSEVEKPVLPERRSTKKPTEPPTPEEIEQFKENAEKFLWFTAVATVYGENTFVTWWSHNEGENKKFTCWSNIDWHHLSGFSAFRAFDQKFDFLLLPSNGSLPDLERIQREEGEAFPIPKCPSTLTSLEENGPLYALMSGVDTNQSAMNFIEGIHELYAKKSEQLQAAHFSRKEQWEIGKRELKENPPEKEDVVIHYWPGKGAREISK